MTSSKRSKRQPQNNKTSESPPALQSKTQRKSPVAAIPSKETSTLGSRWFIKLCFFAFILAVIIYVWNSGNQWMKTGNAPELSKSEGSKIVKSSPMMSLPSNQSTVMHHTRTILSFGPRLVTDQKQVSRKMMTGHERTVNYIVSQFDSSLWEIEYDVQSQSTVLGNLDFKNLIVTWKGGSVTNKMIIVAAHYESKLIPSSSSKVFLGATDSVVPCAMMLDFAREYERNRSAASSLPFYTLQFVFFDGEEAFVNWSPTDSIYGARQLAQKWEKQNKLTSIHFLLLLDLIGTKDTKLYNYGIHFQSHTHLLFKDLSAIEDELRQSRLLKTKPKYFVNSQFNAMIEDDHIPFYQRNVPVLHLIPTPFPAVWHTLDDDYEALDFNTTDDLQTIITKFLLNQFNEQG